MAMTIWWSVLSTLMAITVEYWQLSILRALMVLGNSSAIAVGSGIVSDHFGEICRGAGKKIREVVSWLIL